MNNRVLIGMVLGAVLGVAVVVPLHAGPGKPPEGSNPHKGKRTHESLVVPVSFPGGLTYSSKKWADVFESTLDEYLGDGWVLHSWEFIPNTAGVLVVFQRPLD